MATNLPFCFLIQFLEEFLKFLVNFTLLKYVKCQISYGFLITKELIFGFQILDLKDHFSASLTAVALTFWPPTYLKICPCQNEYFAYDNGVFRSCDRYLNSCAKLLKLTKVVSLYLALLANVNHHNHYFAVIALSFIKFATSAPGRLKVYLR